MISHSSFYSVMLRLFPVLVFFAVPAVAAAQMNYLVLNPIIDRDFVLTGDSESPARNGVPVEMSAILWVNDGGELASYRFAWQLESQETDGTWAIVSLAGGVDTIRSTAEAVGLSADPNIDLPSAIGIAHNGSIQPENPLNPYVNYRVRGQLERLPILGSWGNVETPRTSSVRNLYHFTNTSSNDTARNVIATLHSVSVEDPYILDDSAHEPYQGFEVEIDATIRRWDRYALNPISTLIPVHFQVELRERSSGNLIPVRQPDSITRSFVSYTLNGDIKVPSVTNFTHSFRVQPLEQIDSLKEYDLTVTIGHDELPGIPKTGNAVTLEETRLYHFNGLVDFNGVGAVMSYFFRTLPASVTTSDHFVQIRLERAMGWLEQKPDWMWDTSAPSSTSLTVRLYPDGTAQAYAMDDAMLVWPSPGTAPEYHEINGVRYQLGAMGLSLSEIQGSVAVRLPQGIGVTDVKNGRQLTGIIPMAAQLDTNFQPTGINPIFDTGQILYVVEETKPVAITATSITWDVQNGAFEFATAGDVTYVREPEVTFLKNAPISVSEQTKLDNSGYYAAVSGIANSSLHVQTGDDGSAKLDAEFTFSAGEFVTHFPYGSMISHGTGLMQIEENRVTGGMLENVDPFYVGYFQDCPDGDCFNELGQQAGIFQIFAPTLTFTADGGLIGEGSLAENDGFLSKSLNWGYIAAMSGRGYSVYAHSFDSFETGVFHTTGHFLPGTGGRASDFELEGAATAAAEAAPGIIHLSAALIDQGLARPGSEADKAGTHNYAGINLRVEGETDLLAEAVIAGERVSYIPRDCSRFYARMSGVTGKLEALPGSFPDSLLLSGYPFEFSYYGLGFISNSTNPERSFTAGSLHIPGPTNEMFEFDGLSFTCLGGLDKARLPDGGLEKRLEFWNADLEIRTLQFVTSESCDPDTATYATLGVRAFSTFIDQPLHGVLGIQQDGTLITQQFSEVEGLETEITSRLRLPNNLKLTGPAEEVYQLTAVSEAYFNDFNEASDSQPGDGWLNFAAKINVPFFEDLKAHVRSTASKNTDPDSIVHLAGGWTDTDENTFFTAAFFDPDNRAYPPDVSEDLYFNLSGAAGDPTPYLVRARQEWLNVVPFDYPLQWSPSLRSFTAYEPTKETDLLVVKIDHQLDYLSAENAEISFGAVYQGMPRINLTNFAFNKIDEGTGALQAMTEALQAEAVGALENGLHSLDRLLNDRIDALLEEFLVTAVDPIIDSLYDGFKTASETVDDANEWKDEISETAKQYLTGTVDQQADSLREAIRQLSQAIGSAGSFIGTIDSSLEDVQLALRVIYGEIYLLEEGGISLDPPTVPNPIQGLLTVEDGEYRIVQALIGNLINEMADEMGSEIAAILNNMIEGPTEELNRLLNEQLEKVQPTLERVREVVATLDERIGQVRNQLKTGGEFIDELNAILTSADARIVAVTEEIRETVENFVIADIPVPEQFVEFSPEELKQRIRQEIQDRIQELNFLREYQLALRQRLYDLDLAIKEGIDTAFAQVNLVLKNLVGEYLTQFDDKINGFLGDLGETLGAGQLDGFAHIRGDALRLLRLDAYLQLQVPDELEFNGYLQIMQLSSDGTESCSLSDPTAVANEVTMGALAVPVSWLSPGMKIDVEGKFSFRTGPFQPIGLGGSFEMVDGEFGFEAFTVTDFGAAMSFGLTENYIAAKAGLRFQSYALAGGVFFGRTCSPAPLEMVNPQVASVLGDPSPTFSGAYVYGEAHIPVSEVLLGIPASCMFKITAGVGVGAFYFVEGPTYGGQMLLAAAGEALCLVSIKGDLALVGAKVADDFRFSGQGRLTGRVGACPFCVKFGKNLQLEYQNDRWKFEL